jgi:DNA helicase-2/ATP-dependent DNA helicase PcrA
MPLIICSERKRLLETSGHIVVRGGAGSGKTTIALAKAGADLEAGKLGDHGKVLFLSFARATVARVAEMAVATLPREHRARLEINTYHGFAWSVLKSHAYLVGGNPGVSLLLPARARGRLVGLEGAARLRRQREIFEQEGLVAFELFAPLMTEIVRGCAVVAKAHANAYPLIIVDEFQDTNAEEWAMVQSLGERSSVIALGDPKQRIYDFKGADPKRFDEFVATFHPSEFDFKGENNRSPGTSITSFANDLITGEFDRSGYNGVTILPYTGQSHRPLKSQVLAMVNRLRRANGEWSLAVLVPSNALAASVFDYMRQQVHGLPSYPAEIVVSAEGPALASHLIALLLEPVVSRQMQACAFLGGLAAFNLGKADNAAQSAVKLAASLEKLSGQVAKDATALNRTVLGRAVATLLDAASGHALTGDPLVDWLTIRRFFDASQRDELKSVGKEARHMRLLRRGAQIEATFADCWRSTGTYRDARKLLDSALVEDQFAATTRPLRGVTVMTIHKAKGKEFDEVVVYEGAYARFQHGESAESVRSARFNLHVAVTRARQGVTILTPAAAPCALLPW